MKNTLYMVRSEITPFTMAIMPRKTEKGGLGSFILEDNEEYFVKDSPSKVIDLACKFFGASLRGS